MAWSPPRPEAPEPEPDATLSAEDAADEGAPRCERPPALDPERSADSAARRARIDLRRYCTALRIDRLCTLTFRCRRCDVATGCVCVEGADRPKHDELDYVLACIARFRRRMREEYGPTPLAIVVEHHQDGTLHVHAGYARFLDEAKVRSCWPHGFISLRKRRVKNGQHMGQRERARRCAAYLSKYLGKEAGHGTGRKSYSTTRGLVPEPRRTRLMTQPEALRWLELQTGQRPERVWSSEDVEGWEAPPVLILFYGDA